MSTADHILDQIDTCLGDYDVSDDAMRCAPDLPPLAREPAPRRTRNLLIQRLIDRHNLAADYATAAVLAIERGLTDGPHAELAAAEARAVMNEMVERLRIAIQPMAEGAVAALKQLSESLARLRESTSTDDCSKPTRPRDRPAWQSPYGPPRRR